MASPLDELFKRINNMEIMLARVDERTARQDEFDKRREKEHEDHEQRLRNLEEDNAKHKGGLAVATICGSIAGAAISGLMWLAKAIYGGNN